MDKSRTAVTLRGFPVHLMLARAPKYLRFVCSGSPGCSRAWDALDQLDDTPQPGEKIVAAVLMHRGSMHVDRVVGGRRVGEWHASAEYLLIDEQPPDDVMRSSERWQAWCLEREAAQAAG